MRNGRASLRNTDRESWLLRINGRDVRARPHRLGPGTFRVSTDQGTPTFGPTADTAQIERALAAFSLTAAKLAPDLPRPSSRLGFGTSSCRSPQDCRSADRPPRDLEKTDRAAGNIGAAAESLWDDSTHHTRPWSRK
jgi:hypothetical protein